MKHIKQLLVFLLIISVFNSCEKEEEVSYALDDISAPTDIAALFDISTEEVGLVTITPSANGATMFEVYFGDDENETPTEVAPGETITHVYGEGEFNLRIVAVGLTGLTSELVRVVTISLEAPEDLDVDIKISDTNPFEIEVSASATNATVFDIYFGDTEDEEPTTIIAGETQTHVYAEVGDYTVKVVARGAGAATLEYTEEITINGAVNAVTLPITFEDATVNYAVGGFGASDFGPIPAEVIENPDASGINTSGKVLSVNKTADAQVYAGASIPLEGPIDFTNGTTVSLKVWSPRAGTPILLKLEDSNSPANNDGNPTVFVEIQTSSTLVNTWEELTFDLSSIESFSTSISYDNVIVFPDFNTPGKGELFYFDDIKLAADGDGGDGGTEAEFATSLPMDFEDNKTFSGVFEAGQGVTGELVGNPDKSGENTSETVFQYTKASGAAWYSGIYQVFPSNIDLSTDKSFTFKIWSPKAGINVRMNLEKEGGDSVLSIDQTLTEANKWVTLTYNFSDLINSGDVYDKLVIFPDFNDVAQAPADGSVYYIDDLEQTSGGDGDGGNGDGDGECVSETGESLSAADFNLTFLTNDVTVVQDNANYARVANPKEDAVNSSCFVGEVKNLNQNPWDNIQIDLNAKLDFDANAGFKIKVYSPKAGTKVTVKLEEKGNAGNSTEVGVARTKTGEWEELTIPFPSSASGKFDKIVLFFDLESTNGDTYYFDDLKLYPRTDGGGDGDTDGGTDGGGDGASSIVNGDFETGDKTGWLFFDASTTNGGSVSVSDAESNGGTYSAKITSGQFNNPGIKQERFGAGTILPNTQYQIKLDSKVESLVDGAVVNVLAFSESAVEGDPAILHNLGTVNVAPGSWNTNTFTFTTGGTVSGGVSLLIEVVCGGAATCNGVVYIDNVSISN